MLRLASGALNRDETLKELKRYHERNWHAGVAAMKRALTRSEALDRVLDLVKEVVERCKICAGFAPKPRDPITKTSICTYFGQRVQADLWLVEEEIALLLVDEFS
eukprot:182241-Heterocapsa_arctica.AAC.1